MNKSRIGFRLLAKQKNQMQLLVQKGQFKNLSEILRLALQEFLENRSKRGE